MNSNLKALVKACQKLGISHEIKHSSQNIVIVQTPTQKHHFVNWTTPLNSGAIVQLCKDKDYFYTIHKDIIPQPVTYSFLDPYCAERFSTYQSHSTINSIAKAIETKLHYPLILKKNTGSWGRNVFLVHTPKELEKAILTTFDSKSSDYDYICLAQEYIRIREEYRVIFLHGQFMFAYKKDNEQAHFTGNLSPLHWQGAQAVLITDELLQNQLKAFCAPLFQTTPIAFCGLDIALDADEQFWLIEANTSPGFDYFMQTQDHQIIIDLYTRILTNL